MKHPVKTSRIRTRYFSKDYYSITSFISTIIPYLPGIICDLNLNFVRKKHEKKGKSKKEETIKPHFWLQAMKIIYLISKPSTWRPCRALQRLLTELWPIYNCTHFPTIEIKRKNKGIIQDPILYMNSISSSSYAIIIGYNVSQGVNIALSITSLPHYILFNSACVASILAVVKEVTIATEPKQPGT